MREPKPITETKRGNLSAHVETDEIEISNGLVLVRLYRQDGGYVQEFHAADRKGRFHLLLSSIHKDLIPFSEHRMCSSPMISADRPHLFGVTRESLRMAYSEAQVSRHDEHGITAELAGSTLGHNLRCRITLDDHSNRVHVVVQDEVERGWSDPLIEYFMDSYVFLPDGRTLAVGETPDYIWAPSLRPANDHVVGDCAFHSPAAIVQCGPFAAALVPDLDLLGKHRPMSASLDLDMDNGLLPAPLLSYGFCGYEQVYDAQYCRHDVTHSKRLGSSRLSIGYHLMLDADCKRSSAHRQVARFLWEEHGSKKAMSHGGHKPGDRGAARRPLASLDCPDAWAACGLYAAGIQGDDEALIYRARAFKNAVIASPQDRGLFPTRYDTQRKEWYGCNVDIGGAAYNLTECSTQLYWLLEWRREIESDPRIISFCRAYADFLLEARQRSGAIPAWYGPDHIPLSPSRSGNQTAASALFLARLARVTGDPGYLRAAEKSAEFVLRELVSRRLYQDYTLLDTVNGSLLECSDPHTGMRPASGTAMLWVALLCAELSLAEGDRDKSNSKFSSHLEPGIAVLDELCLLQSVWTKPWAPHHLEHGLCARGNVGARYDAELTAEFARCAMTYGALTGEREYCERGAAALRAVLREPGLSALTQARVAASAAAIDGDFGAIYIHVAGKWAVALNGWRVEGIDVEKGSVSVRIEGGEKDGGGRIVFGGMRGKDYSVRVNDRRARYSQQEMASGISVAGEKAAAGPAGQLTLIRY